MSLVQTEVQKPSSFVVDGTTYTFPIVKTGVSLATLTEVVKAPGAGKHIFVTGVMYINREGQITTAVLQYDTDGTPTDLFPTIMVGSNSSKLLVFPQAFKVPGNKNLGVKIGASLTTNGVIVFGKVDVEG